MDPSQIISRFEQHNRTRIERLSKLVSTTQQSFFRLLPFLLHTNIPELPGYGSKETPIGIINYQADDKTINEAQKLSPSFKYKQHGIRHYGIAGLYLINDYGLLKIPSQLSFRLYVIHTDISSEQQQALAYKLKMLTKWAETLKITLTINLKAQQDLQAEIFDPEELDKLYLNGLILAGGIPLWWLVPPGEDYQQHVKSPAQLRTQSHHLLLDFGSEKPLDAEALITRSCHLIDDSIDLGLERLLPLLYSQNQLTLYPNNDFLSNDYKKAIYDNEQDPLALDYKVLQFQHILNSNLTSTTKRLAQQALYIQTQEPLSKHVSQPRFPWRRNFLKQTVLNWTWGTHEFQILDRHDMAKYEQCLEEHKLTQVAFADAQSTIKQFAKQHQITLPKSNTVIDKKLQRLDDLKPNNISLLPKGLATKKAEEQLHFYRFSIEDDWKLSLIPLSSETQKPLYHHKALLHVLSWAISNGLLNKATRILIADKTNRIIVKTVISLVQQLLHTPLNEQININQKASLKPAQLDSVYLFVNLEQSNDAADNPQGIQLTSLHNDPFNYANRGESLLYSIDGLIHSTIGGWQTFQITGKTAPLDLCVYLSSWWANGNTKPSVSCWCPSNTHGTLISHRLKNLYKDVSTHYHKNNEGYYLLLIEDTLYQLSWQPEGIDITALKNTVIEQILAKPKTHFSVCKLDDKLDPTQRFNTLLSCQSKETVSLVVEDKKQTLSIHIVDDLGNLISNHNLKLSRVTVLNHFQHFLSVIQKNKPNLTLRYLTLEPASSSNPSWSLSPIAVTAPNEKQGYLPVIITMASPKADAHCTINCGPKQFSGQANTKVIFQEIASFILSLRKSNTPYPLYINEISFIDSKNVSTADYLLQKQRIEKQLNLD